MNLTEKINELEKIRDICDEWIMRYYQQRREQCRHDGETQLVTHHFEGSYLDKGYSQYDTVCMECEKVLESRTETGWYG